VAAEENLVLVQKLVVHHSRNVEQRVPHPNKTPSEAIANTTEDLGARKKERHERTRVLGFVPQI